MGESVLSRHCPCGGRGLGCRHLEDDDLHALQWVPPCRTPVLPGFHLVLLPFWAPVSRALLWTSSQSVLAVLMPMIFTTLSMPDSVAVQPVCVAVLQYSQHVCLTASQYSQHVWDSVAILSTRVSDSRSTHDMCDTVTILNTCV